MQREEASLGASLFSAQCMVIDVASLLEQPSAQDTKPCFKADFSQGRCPPACPAYQERWRMKLR